MNVSKHICSIQRHQWISPNFLSCYLFDFAYKTYALSFFYSTQHSVTYSIIISDIFILSFSHFICENIYSIYYKNYHLVIYKKNILYIFRCIYIPFLSNNEHKLIINHHLSNISGYSNQEESLYFHHLGYNF